MKSSKSKSSKIRKGVIKIKLKHMKCSLQKHMKCTIYHILWHVFNSVFTSTQGPNIKFQSLPRFFAFPSPACQAGLGPFLEILLAVKIPSIGMSMDIFGVTGLPSKMLVLPKKNVDFTLKILIVLKKVFETAIDHRSTPNLGLSPHVWTTQPPNHCVVSAVIWW